MHHIGTQDKKKGVRSIAGDIYSFYQENKSFHTISQIFTWVSLARYLIKYICIYIHFTSSLLWQGTDFPDPTDFRLGHVTHFR